MSNRIVAVVGTRYRDLSIEEAALAPLGVELRRGPGASADEIADVAGDAEVILAGGPPRFDAATLERLSCRGIVRLGVGVESVDLDAARERGIWVTYVPDYGTEAVAVHAVALALAAARRLREADATMRAGGWGFADLRPLHLPSAMTVGVIGYGRIGRRAAGLFAGLGFRVLAHDAFAPISAPAQAASLDELLEASHIVSLHAPGDPSGAPLLGVAELGRMREGAVLVNTSRGSLIDVAALVAGLRAGRPGTAALDVFAGEPPDLAVFAPVLDHLVLTPHMAWYTEESERILRQKAAAAVHRLLTGQRPDDVVVEGAALTEVTA